MSIITKQLLNDIGVAMSDQNIEILSEHFETTLDNRVVNEITQELDADLLKQLNMLQEQGTDVELGEWLKQNVPDLKEIIDDETAILLGELADGADNL